MSRKKIDPKTGRLVDVEPPKTGTYGMTEVAGKMIITQPDESNKDLGDRYGFHNKLVRKT